MDILNIVLVVIEILIGGGTIIGGVWAIHKSIVQPIKDMSQKINGVESSLTSTVHQINNDVLPVIDSLSKEFSKNSGKSIMDKITRMDDSIRLAELRSKLLASNLTVTGVIEFDKDGNYVWGNEYMTDLTGLESSKLLDNGWLLPVKETDRPRVWALWTDACKNDIPFDSDFVFVNTKTNATHSVKCTILPHKTVDGKILGFHGSIKVKHTIQ